MDKMVLLKNFGIIPINKIVKAHKCGDLWHVFLYEEWHRVPESDIEDDEEAEGL